MKKTLFHSRRYKSFVNDRDHALEKILHNALLDISRIAFDSFDQVEKLASQILVRYNPKDHAVNGFLISHNFEKGVGEIMAQIWPLIVRRIESMRAATYLIAYASEQEAIGRATQKRSHVTQDQFRKRLTQAVKSKTILDQKLTSRIWMDLVRARHRIIQAFELGLVQELDAHEIVDKVKDAFPRVKAYRRAPRTLTKIKEASYEGPKKSWLDFDYIDDASWEFAVQAYKDTELDPGRFDQSAEYYPETGMITYDWEVERDVTEDFVQQVRSGQIEAANDLGIKDLVWVAIIDDRTDACCLKRHGHTSQEIEEMLANGRLNPDDCDAIAPPAHQNCRCNVAPVASVDEVQGPDWQSFDGWLNS